MINSKEKIIEELGLNSNYFVGDFQRKYTLKKILKKDGTFREIKPPNIKLRGVQRKILDDYLSVVDLPNCVYGLSKNRGVKNNASMHQINAKKHILVLDIKDFFPSISYKEIKNVFKKIGFDADCANCLAKLCTISSCLPQGAPTSPYLSALVFLKIDGQIQSYASKNNLVYTRYFDDITLSGDVLTKKMIRHVEKIIEKTGYILNDTKKEVLTPKETKVITGVVVGKDCLDVTEEYKDKIKITYDRFLESRNIAGYNSFFGQLGFYLYINRVFAVSFFKEITGIDYDQRIILFKDLFVDEQKVSM